MYRETRHLRRSFASIKTTVMKEIDLFDNRPKRDRSMQRENAINAKPKSVLEAFENIVELAEDSNLSDEFFETAKLQIAYAGRRLRLSPMQTVMLALFVDRSEDSRIYISEIAKYTGCRTTRFLRLSKEIDNLEDKHYLKASRSSQHLSYRVPSDVLKALKENQPYTFTQQTVNDLRSFFDMFAELAEQKDNDELTYDKLESLTRGGLDDIKDSLFAKHLKNFNLSDNDTILFIFMAHLFVENNDDNIGFHDIDDLYDNNKIPGYVRNELRCRESALFDRKLIENVNEEGMARSDAFKLTDYAKSEVLGELNLHLRRNPRKHLLRHDSFAEKKLIYNQKERDQIAELSSILSRERFDGVQQRLEKAGMRKGFCCLFYGAPGTGKTETVYQLARLT